MTRIQELLLYAENKAQEESIAEQALADAKHEHFASLENVVHVFTEHLQENFVKTLEENTTDEIGIAFALARYIETVKIYETPDPERLPGANDFFVRTFPKYYSEKLWQVFTDYSEDTGFYIRNTYYLRYNERNGREMQTTAHIHIKDAEKAKKYHAVFDKLVQAVALKLTKKEVLRVWRDDIIFEYQDQITVPIWLAYKKNDVYSERNYSKTFHADISPLDIDLSLL